MYLGELLAYPIWLYIGASVIAIVGSAIKNSKGQVSPTPSAFYQDDTKK